MQWNLDLRKLDLRKNLDLKERLLVSTTGFLVQKLFDLRKFFLSRNVRFKTENFPKMLKNRGFLTILEQFQKKIKFCKKYMYFHIFLIKE